MVITHSEIQTIDIKEEKYTIVLLEHNVKNNQRYIMSANDC